MEFEANMVTKDGKKMMYMISIKVKEDCEDYDAIWTELNRRMYAVEPSAPIVRVDWAMYDDNHEAYDFSECLFNARSFEIGMGFLLGIMNVHEIRANLDYCYFYNGDAFKGDMKKYKVEDTLKAAKRCFAKRHPNETW